MKRSAIIALMALSMFAIQGCGAKKAKMTRRDGRIQDVSETQGVRALDTENRADGATTPNGSTGSQAESNKKTETTITVTAVPKAPQVGASPAAPGASATTTATFSRPSQTTAPAQTQTVTTAEAQPTIVAAPANQQAAVESKGSTGAATQSNQNGVSAAATSDGEITQTVTTQVGDGYELTRTTTTEVAKDPKVAGYVKRVTEKVETSGTGQDRQGGVRATYITTYKVSEGTGEATQVVTESSESKSEIVYKEDVRFVGHEPMYLLNDFVDSKDFYNDDNIVAEISGKGVDHRTDLKNFNLTAADIKAIADSGACRQEVSGSCLVVDGEDIYSLSVREKGDNLVHVYRAEIAEESLKKNDFGSEDYSAITSEAKSESVIKRVKGIAKDHSDESLVVFTRAYSQEALKGKLKNKPIAAPVVDGTKRK